MPVKLGTSIARLSQAEFADISYQVMGEVFEVHGSYGRLFDEVVYKKALASRLKQAKTEVEIQVWFEHFSKKYYLDLVVAPGAIFELKAVEKLSNEHKSQLLNYLLLTGAKHGKLVNFRTEHVEHEFVNTKLSPNQRRCFQIDDSQWSSTGDFNSEKKNCIVCMLKDWGTGLSRSLYDEAVRFFLGVEANRSIQVPINENLAAKQTVSLCAQNVALRVTAFDETGQGYRESLKRFMGQTGLEAIQWINIAYKKVIFDTIV